MGAAGHVLRTAGLLTPLLIGEFVKDADTRWRYTRIGSLATALLSEGIMAKSSRLAIRPMGTLRMAPNRESRKLSVIS